MKKQFSDLITDEGSAKFSARLESVHAELPLPGEEETVKVTYSWELYDEDEMVCLSMTVQEAEELWSKLGVVLGK